jgi:hypothetical protein
MSQTVAGKALVGLGESGRMRHEGSPGPVWVVGRAAGARDYAASLISGVRAAVDIAESFGVGVSPGASGAGPRGHGLGLQGPELTSMSASSEDERGGDA